MPDLSVICQTTEALLSGSDAEVIGGYGFTVTWLGENRFVISVTEEAVLQGEQSEIIAGPEYPIEWLPEGRTVEGVTEELVLRVLQLVAKTKWYYLIQNTMLGDGFTAWEHLNNQGDTAYYIYGECPVGPSQDIQVRLVNPDIDAQLGGDIQTEMVSDVLVLVKTC